MLSVEAGLTKIAKQVFICIIKDIPTCKRGMESKQHQRNENLSCKRISFVVLVFARAGSRCGVKVSSFAMLRKYRKEVR